MKAPFSSHLQCMPFYSLAFLVSAGLCSCSGDRGSHETIASSQIVLSQGWEFRNALDSLWMPANVPGDAMTDLMQQGKLENPFAGTNERASQWVETQDWHYQCVFELMPHRGDSKRPLQELVFKGIDTFAEIRLNGILQLKTDNMHRTHVLPISNNIQSPCTLEIALRSAVNSGKQIMDDLQLLIPTSNENRPLDERTSSVTRKAKYQFGWDWGPRLTSCGIWRPVILRETRPMQSEDIQLSLVSLDAQEAIYEIKAPFDLESQNMRIEGPNGSRVHWNTTLKNEGNCLIKISNPELWWPRGMGRQPLYTLSWSGENQHLNVRFGIRKMQWNRTQDAFGTSFECVVNDIPFFAKGANIIPPDFFPARALNFEDRLIDAAIEANMNMLRIWGGGIYPSQSFLDKCDERGLVIWQDFMFACGMVRGDSAHQTNVKLEAIDQLKKMRNHACMGLFCGNNESMHAWQNWGWPKAFDLHDEDSLATEQAYHTIFESILPHAIDSLTDLDYWPSSPMEDPNETRGMLSGDEHAWRVWFDTLDFDYFSGHRGRFASEYGLQSLPHRKTLNEVGITEWDDEALQFRQRSSMEWLKPGLDGWGMMQIYARRYTADPAQTVEASETDGTTALNRWIYLSQLTQAIGLQEAIERHRNSHGKIAGSLYWQLDDVWPTVSWSTVDHAGRWKLAHHAVKHANADCRVIWNRSNPTTSSMQLHNQSPKQLHNTELHVQWRNERGELEHEATKTTHLNPFESIELSFPSIPNESALVSWTWIGDDGGTIDAGHVLLTKPSEINWPNAHLKLIQNGNDLIVSTDSIAYGIRLQSDIDGRFTENGFLLLPGNENARHVQFLPTHHEGTTLGVHSARHFAQFQ